MPARHALRWPSASLFALLIGCGLPGGMPHPVDAQPLYVATPTAIFQLDAAGTRRVFFDPSVIGIRATPFADVAVSRSGAVYAIESARGVVWRLVDANSNGNAHDPGEATVFRDETAVGGVRLKAPFSMAITQVFDVDRKQLRDVLYVMDPELQATVKLQDVDGNGNAQGPDEACLFHQSTLDKRLSAVRMTTEDSGRLLAVNPNIGGALRLVDHNKDCTITSVRETACPAGIISSEYHVVKDDSGASPDFNQPFGIAAASRDAIFVSDLRLRSEDRAGIVRLQDLNGNDDAQGAGEARVFNTGLCEDDRLAFFSPVALAVDRKDALYVADQRLGMILRLEDKNADGDAMDAGECRVFARGFTEPIGLASQPPPLPPLGLNLGGDVADLGKGPDLLLPDGATKLIKVEVVDRTTDKPMANMKVYCEALVGCLQCAPKYGRTDSAGRIDFTVSRVSAPTNDESLVVSTLGDSRIINVISQRLLRPLTLPRGLRPRP